ncbi:uncharacterized protein N7487_011250 [Penicillium crustosum]|uniref:uncharacterized protein n=1 Tax=Penicillium crustosum TaxID=36656 RepID=UPI0023A16787|nr:uncharacterized protein N7487_011250 [Penicillium crustosum]KAJ5393609.1 hypothetical protein N7487_011250 [Penicillium crustosum]
MSQWCSTPAPQKNESSDAERATKSGDHESAAQSEEHDPRRHQSRARAQKTVRPNLSHGAEPTSNGIQSATLAHSEPLNHIPTRPVIAAKTRLERAMLGLEVEKRSHDQTRKELDRLKQILKNKNEELHQVGSDKEKWERLAVERLKKFKGAAQELNQLIISTQVFGKVNDSDLLAKAEQLRGDIDNLSYCHLKEPKDLDISDATYKLFEQRLGLPQATTVKYFQSPLSPSELVQAFIWQTLRVRVFGRFRWMPQSSESMSAMSGFLEQFLTSGSNAIPDAKRRFHTWRATTTNVMAEVVGLDTDKVSNYIEKFSEEQARLTTEELHGLVKLSSHQKVEDELCAIFDDSVTLSEMIDTQLACITWSDVKHRAADRSALGRAEPQSGRSRSSDNRDSRLLVAPGLVRSGRSSGDKFDVEVIEILPPLFKLIG